MSQRHIVHLIYRFAAGGLENVIVQLVNGLPHEEFRHTIVALTTVDAAFANRIRRPDVKIIALDKQPGQPFKMYPAMYRLLRQLRPDVMQTCNIAALEFMPVAALAGVPLRIHAEHGWDVADPDGSNYQYQILRKIYQRFVHQFVVVSEQLEQYLLSTIGISAKRVKLIRNGVDTDRFRPWQVGDFPPEGFPFNRQDHWVVGTVGRLEPIKDQTFLARAFVRLVKEVPEQAHRLRLAIVGAGPMEADIRQIVRDAGLEGSLWLPGVRADIPEILRALDCFVLPSISEGTSCTLQEAMASALSIVATEVGGNAALLDHGKLGILVRSKDEENLAKALLMLQADENHRQNREARVKSEQQYSLQQVVQSYRHLFQ